MASGETEYARVPQAALRIVPLDELTLIYHRASGQTHVVAPPVPELLGILDEKPVGLDAILARLTATFDLGDADPDALAARLDEMADIGLVIRA